jgi:hypothetical protein
MTFQSRIDLSPYEWNFDLDMPGQKFHHSLKEHHKISEIDNREIDNQMIKLIIIKICAG